MRFIAILAAFVATAAFLHQSSGQNAVPLPKRVPWTSSKIHGTPEPPHPFKAERVFPKLSFNEPVYMVHAPGLDRWFVGEHFGKIYSFPKNQAVEKADLAIDLQAEVKSWDPASNVKRINEHFALVFHPQFAKNRYCYICYILESKNGGEALPDGSRISRFTVTDTDPPRIDPKSEKVIITWLGGGHNGCDLHFGNDGFLYISTGDGSNPNPPDRLNTGQDCSDLLSSILRIDVDKTDTGLGYAIPKDNPFVGLPKVRGEIFAFGFRNPWRMSFDRRTGDLWVGDVGWELWEMVDRVQKGGNYGWPIKEGNQDVRPGDKPGPTPPLPPTLAFPHTEAASITGGFVYHGKKFPELEGAYICGDWVTRKIWATKFDGDKIVSHKEIAQTNARIVAFGEDTEGELYIVDHNNPAGIYTLVPNPTAKNWTDTFPRKLSETGLFASAKDHKLAAGVQRFEILAHQWIDGAGSDCFIALPDRSAAKIYDEPYRNEDEFWSASLILPKDGVLAKTISMEMTQNDSDTTKRIETQILHFDGKNWNPYTYLWRDDQTDADLVDAKGRDIVLERKLVSEETPRKQTWHIPSRTECRTCHNPWAGFALAFTPLQLQRNFIYSKTIGRQIEDLKAGGFLDLVHRQGNKEVPMNGTLPPGLENLSNPFADKNSLARTYLHVNCAHCHQMGAGGSADIDLRFNLPLSKTKIVGVRPTQGDFGINGAKIVAPGDPSRSTLLLRMATTGRGRMPHIGSNVVDIGALQEIRAWIQSLLPDVEADEQIAQLTKLDDHPNANHDPKRAEQRVTERQRLMSKLLETPSSALLLLEAVDRSPPNGKLRAESSALAANHTNSIIRDLFDRHLPDSKRAIRLGSNVTEAKLLELNGDGARGRELFFSAGFQCGNCHKVQGRGGQLGPELSDVSKRLSKTQVIESLLTPSKTIDAKYLTHVVETTAGQVHTGLLAEKTDKEMILRVAGDKEVRVPLADVAGTQTLRTSLMPDNLLRDATARQAGDLLEFLWSLR